MKKKVSERALMSRINRKLAKEDEVLRKCAHNSQWYSSNGDYYIVSLSRNTIDNTHMDIEALGREIGALKDYEELAGE